MRLKTDENLHPEVAAFLRGRGHDALTVWDEDMRGRSDDEIISVCKNENRGLLTFDLDFADIRHYPPRQYAGIIVFRLARQDRSYVLASVARVLPILQAEMVAGDLWMISESGIRVRRD